MFFCDKCRYLFNITKDVKSKQVGGKINEALTNIINNFNNNEQVLEKDLKRIKANDLLHDERFEDLTKKLQRKLISNIKALDKNFFVQDNEEKNIVGNNAAYFICKYCKNSKPIEPGTLIYSKNYGGNKDVEEDDYTYAIYDQTLARTKNYICKNKKCETHKNIDIREAVLTKNKFDQIVYICTVCNTVLLVG